jgi:hypothetical protein
VRGGGLEVVLVGPGDQAPVTGGALVAHGPDAVLPAAGNAAFGKLLQGLTAAATPPAGTAVLPAAGPRAEVPAGGTLRALPTSSFIAAWSGGNGRDALGIGLAGAPAAREAALQAVLEVLATGANRGDRAGAHVPMAGSTASAGAPGAVPAVLSSGGGRAAAGGLDSTWSAFMPKRNDDPQAADVEGGSPIVSLAGAALVVGAALPATVALERERRRTEQPRPGSSSRPARPQEPRLPRQLPSLKRLAILLVALTLSAAGVQLFAGSQVERMAQALLQQAAGEPGQVERPAADLGQHVAYQPPAGEARVLAGARLPWEPRPDLAAAALRSGRRLPRPGGRSRQGGTPGRGTAPGETA